MPGLKNGRCKFDQYEDNILLSVVAEEELNLGDHEKICLKKIANIYNQRIRSKGVKAKRKIRSVQVLKERYPWP